MVYEGLTGRLRFGKIADMGLRQKIKAGNLSKIMVKGSHGLLQKM